MYNYSQVNYELFFKNITTGRYFHKNVIFLESVHSNTILRSYLIQLERIE